MIGIVGATALKGGEGTALRSTQLRMGKGKK